MPPAAKPRRVLLVCLGNICRSPTMEAVLRAQAKRAGLDMHFDSAGTENYHHGEPPDPRSIEHARRRGYELATLRARQVCAQDFSDFDLILAADEANLATLRAWCPAARHDRLELFLGNRALPDPYYGESDGFEKVLNLTEKRAESLILAWRSGN
jgi:protein-tyrosine phosphatase